MKSHVKNILAGVGTGAVVVLLAVLSIMSFASISGGEREVSLTVVKQTVPQSDPNASVEETAFLFHLYQSEPNGEPGTRPYGDKLFWLLDDDGVDPNPSIPNDGEPPTSLTRIFNINASGNQRFTLKEEENEYALKHFSFYTTWACYTNDQYPSGAPFATGFGRSANFDFEEKDNITCKFVNTLTDAKLTVTKVFDPSVSEKVDIAVIRDNNLYDNFSLVDGQNKEVFLTSGHEFLVNESYTQKNLKTSFLKYDTSYGCDNNLNGIGLGIDLGRINAGDDIKCTFTNKKNPEISIKKTVISGDKNKKFDFDLNFYDRLGVLNRSVPINLGDGEVESELYGTTESGWVTKITEKVDPNYSASYECKIYSHTGDLINTLADDKSTVELPALDFGQKVDCEFFNKTTEITIKKDVLDENGNDIESEVGEKFEIESEKTRQTFTLDDNLSTFPTPPNSFTINNVQAGVDYKFVELDINNVVSLKYNTTWFCDNGDSGSGLELTANIQKGVHLTCTFINTKKPPAFIYIKKDVVNYLGIDVQSKIPETFKFLNKNDISEFFLDDNDDPTYSNEEKINVIPGISYVFEELLTPSQKYEVSWVCTDGNQTTGTDTSIEAPILGAGESITCTLTNKELQKSKITITKEEKPFENTYFVFNVLENTNLVDEVKILGNGSEQGNLEVYPGVYDIEESLQTNGKSYITSYVCEFSPSRKAGNDIEGNGRIIKNIDINVGEDIWCDFKNLILPQITVIKQTIPSILDEDFTVRLTQGLNNTSLLKFNTAKGNTTIIQDVKANQPFSLKEDIKTGVYTTYSCTNGQQGNGVGPINLPAMDYGEKLSCTFINCRPEVGQACLSF